MSNYIVTKIDPDYVSETHDIGSQHGGGSGEINICAID
jgi:hypothetical protein